MKICIISNYFPPAVRGGYEIGARDIALKLHQLGHDVRVLTAFPVGGQIRGTVPNYPFPVRQIFEPVVVYDDIVIRNDRIWNHQRSEMFGGIVASNCIALDTFLESDPVDAIWCFNILGLGPVGILEVGLARCGNVMMHLMENIDGVILDHQNDHPLLGRLAGLKRSIKAISCSRKVMASNSLIGEYGSHIVVYNGVRFPATCPARVPAAHGPLRLIYFGQIESHKGILQALDALALLKDRIEFTFDLYGGGGPHFRAELNHRVKELGLSSSVRVNGFIPKAELLDSLPTYDAALLLMGENEPFAYVQLEAVAAGLPLITTNAGGFVEWGRADYPFMVKSRDDPKQVASVIDALARDKQVAANAARRLFESVKPTCDLDEVVMPSYVEHLESPALPACPTKLLDTLSSAYTVYLSIH